MRAGKSNVLVATCLLAGMALACGNYVIWHHPVDITPLDSIGEVSLVKPSVEAFPDVAWSTEFQPGEALDRPLFSPTRREYIAPLVKTPEQQVHTEIVEARSEPLRPDVRFLGTRSLNGTRAALVEVGGNEPSWITIGEVFNTWNVTSVTDRKLVLTQGEQLIELDLYHDQ